MKYDVTFDEMSEMLDDMLNHAFHPADGKTAEKNWLWEISEDDLKEAERLNVLLPLIRWELEHNMLTKWMHDELYLYYRDLANGKLDPILGDDEADEVKRVLTECFNKVFPEGLEK